MRWQRIETTSRWYLDFMAPDGTMVDFGDSWAKRGMNTTPINGFPKAWMILGVYSHQWRVIGTT